jgi:hypothetical protein
VALLAAVEAPPRPVAEALARAVSVVTPSLVASALAIGPSPAAIPEAAPAVVAAAGELDLDFLPADGFAVHAA